MNQQPAEPIVILTGASTGIGLATAHLLQASSCRLVVTARKSSLPRLYAEGFKDSARIIVRELEITDPEQREKLVSEVVERWGGIDVLVNNAGISYRSVTEEMSTNEDIEQLETNYIAPFALTRLVLPYMRKQRRGHIINVSSVGGMMAMPTMGSYSASKFALEGASEALWYEMRPWNVHITLIQPGFIRSNSFMSVRLSRLAKLSSVSNGVYSTYYTHMSDFVKYLMERALATPESIARKIVRCMYDANPPLRVPATIDAYLFSMLRRFLPRNIYHWILYRNLPGIRFWGTK